LYKTPETFCRLVGMTEFHGDCMQCYYAWCASKVSRSVAGETSCSWWVHTSFASLF